MKSFDALKGFSVLLVVIWGHYWQFTPAGYWCEETIPWLSKITNQITQLSFKTYSFMAFMLMISGFQLVAQYQRIADGKVRFSDYLKKRIYRLFPLTVISTVVMVIGLVLHSSLIGEAWYGTAVNGRYIVENLLNIQAWGNTVHTLNGPLWYVSVYFFCCILYFALIRLGEKINTRYIIMATPIVIGIFFGDKNMDKLLLNADMCRGYIGFFAGVLLAYVAGKLSEKQMRIYAVAALLCYAVFRDYCEEAIFSGNMLDQVLPAICFLFAPILLLLYSSEKLDRIVGNKVFAGLGKVSYGLYVWNFPFYLWMAVWGNVFGWKVPYGLDYMYWIMPMIQILIAVLTYNFVEKPIYKCLNKK